MPAPLTGEALLELVRKSEVSDAATLAAFAERTGPLPACPLETARLLVQAEIITAFHAQQLVQGKYKGFHILGRYKVLDRIGVLGFGQAYRVEHTRSKRRLTLRVWPQVVIDDPNTCERLWCAVRLAASLDHPNVAQMCDVDSDERGTLYLILENLDGQPLGEILSAGRFPVGEACGCAVQIAHGLQHAHEQEVVHHSLHPGSVLVTHSGVVKLVDLGLAQAFRDSGFAVRPPPEYAAPEQAPDRQADVFALGVLLKRLLREEPGALASFLARMTARDPAERPQLAEILPALCPYVVPDPGRALPPMASAALAAS